MKIRLPHIPYISRKIAIDLYNSKLVTFSAGLEGVVAVADEILRDDTLKERGIDEKVNEILDANMEDINTFAVDKKDMFWLIKKRVAKDNDFALNYEDRYSALSHEILENIWKKGFVDYSVSENKIKNIIYQSIKNYLKIYESIEDDVVEQLENFKKKLVPGSQEYELMFEKLYEEELKKRGMF